MKKTTSIFSFKNMPGNIAQPVITIIEWDEDYYVVSPIPVPARSITPAILRAG